MTTPAELTALHAVARAALRYRDRTGTQGVLSEALDRLTASGWRPDGPESEAPPTTLPDPATSRSRAINARAWTGLLAEIANLDAVIAGYAERGLSGSVHDVEHRLMREYRTRRADEIAASLQPRGQP